MRNRDIEYISIEKYLNEHDSYLKLLKLLKNRTKYIEVVLINGEEDDELLDAVWDYIAEKRLVKKWHGTIRMGGSRAALYKVYSSGKLFEKLSCYCTFCTVKMDKYLGYIVEETDFGYKDIAFFDEKGEPLLFTTTHEGYVMLRKDLKEEACKRGIIENERSI